MEILATVVPMAGFGILITCIQTCWGVRFFKQYTSLERRVKLLEDQQAAPRVLIAPQPVPAVYPPGRYPYNYTPQPPQPSAPPSYQMV